MGRLAAELIADGGAAAEEAAFFRSPQFLAAEGTTHSLVVAGEGVRVAAPLIVREIAGTDLRDAVSPYGYPGATISQGEVPLAAEEVDWSAVGLVSVFCRERALGDAWLAGPTERSVIVYSDPALDRKSRMSDRQQIRRNERDGFSLRDVAGREASDADVRGLHRVYDETMGAVAASEGYMFGPEYFRAILGAPSSRLFLIDDPSGEVAAAAVVAESDGAIHYYLSGTADAHRRASPSKNLIVAVTDHASERGLPMNLGGGLQPGDGLEQFKRGFANAEAPYRTHEIVCDPDAYERLAGDAPGAGGFFPAYRAPR